MAFFKIGDRVRIYATNLTGSVTDVLRSETGSEIRYLVGFAQAASYAMRKCYEALGGTFQKKGGAWNG